MTNRSFAWSRSKAGTVFVVALALLLDITAAQAGEKVILQFNPTQGYRSFSGLTSDGAGNLYGTTTTGGAANCGTAFELFPGSGGTWTETVLYSFRGCPYPGPSPSGTMVFDKKGNLYGVSLGNLTGGGVIFELSKGTNGTWSYRTIHTFSSSEGAPLAI